MANKHKITTFVLISVLCLICLIFVGKKETDAYSPADAKRLELQKMTYISKHNIFSSSYGIKYIGHRGIGGLAPENTLPSFELAGKLGFWGAECDVRTTSDGNWMVLHDDTVDRMTNGKGKIKDLSFKNVQALNIVSGNNITKYKGTKVPKLQDYLISCKRNGIVPIIEMKTADNLVYYDRFIKIIKKYGSIQKTVVISFSTVSLDELRKRDTNLTLGLLCNDINSFNIEYVKTLGNAFIDCSYINIDDKSVALCHESNIKVGVWTVNNIEIANDLIKRGVDFITTDNQLLEVKEQEAL
jgi:glycerophosphoryl diester phosphodiesterase